MSEIDDLLDDFVDLPSKELQSKILLKAYNLMCDDYIQPWEYDWVDAYMTRILK